MSKGNQTTTSPQHPQHPQTQTPQDGEGSVTPASMSKCKEKNCAPWDKEASLKHLRTKKKTKKPYGDCARYVINAINAGGITADRSRRTAGVSAYGYGPVLESACFTKLSPSEIGSLQAGDVAIFPAIPGHKHGHICMFDGSTWYSDFQQRDIYAGPAYRNSNASYSIYRRCPNP